MTAQRELKTGEQVLFELSEWHRRGARSYGVVAFVEDLKADGWRKVPGTLFDFERLTPSP